jgi:hypothetical protein
MALERSEKVEDLSDYEEALSHAHQFSELELKPSIESQQARNKASIVTAKKPPSLQQYQKLANSNGNNARQKNRSPLPQPPNPYSKNQASNQKSKYD